MNKLNATPRQIEVLKQNIPLIDKADDKFRLERINLVKFIITICVGLISVIVSFYDKKNFLYPQLFSLTLIQISLPVFFGVIILYNEVKLRGRILISRKEDLNKRLNDISPNSVYMNENYEPYWIKIVEICFYFFAFSSFVSLIVCGLIK